MIDHDPVTPRIRETQASRHIRIRGAGARRRSRAAWCAVIASVALSGCLRIGSCTETEWFAFTTLDHYGDMNPVPEALPNGRCGTRWMSGDDPQAVMEHYRSELGRVGWSVEPMEPMPITDASGAVVGRELSIRATVETATASISAEVLDGQDTTFVISIDELD